MASNDVASPPHQEDKQSSPAIKAQIHQVSIDDSQALRDRQIAAVGRLLRRAALIRRRKISSAEEKPPSEASPRREPRR
jgi:hypothetical protein